MQAKDLFIAGRLPEAIAATIEEVKEKPGDPALRLFLGELLCFTGDLGRADKHLDAISTQEPRLALEVALFRHLVRAERCRRECFEMGRLPEFAGPPTPDLQARVQVLTDLRVGQSTIAAETLARMESSRCLLKGTANGIAFDDFRDLDDLTSSFLEVLTASGKYYWIPLSDVRQLEFRKPQRARDLLWRSAHMIARGGMDAEVHLPALYPRAHAETDDLIRLGRFTEWRSTGQGFVQGVGVRMFLIGEEAVSIFELDKLEFQTEEGA